MKQLQLVIFDMDGLMFETGRLAYRAYLLSAQKHDFELTHDVYYYLTGKTEEDIRKGMKALYGEDVSTDVWRDSMNYYKESILKDEKRVFKKTGLIDLLNMLKEYQCLTAVATSSSREKVDHYFSLENMPNYFDLIVTGDQVKNGKPDPEIFLTACNRAKINPKHALVLEDSIAGLKSAYAADIPAFWIEDDLRDLPITKGKHKLRKQPEFKQEDILNYTRQFSDLIEVKNFLFTNKWLS